MGAYKKYIGETGSDAAMVIVSSSSKNKYPVGFEYMAGGEIYKVINASNDGQTEWRRLRRSDGSVEDVTVETIDKDFKHTTPDQKNDAIILKDPYVEKQKELQLKKEVNTMPAKKSSKAAAKKPAKKSAKKKSK